MTKKLLKNSFIYILGDVLNKAVPFFMLPILTRYLTPEDYGIIATFTVLVSFLMVFTGLSIHGSISVNFFKMEKEELKIFIGNCLIILNISSDLGLIAPDQRIYKKEGLPENEQPVKPVTYSVIKHGLIGFTKYLATYWADKGVRCNALCPGGIYNNQPDEFVNKITRLIPMGRMADSDEYKAAIVFLVSKASSYMNGSVVTMDGGRSVS